MRVLKKILLTTAVTAALGLLTGCSVDYTGSFSVKNVTPEFTETKNMISVNYEFTNPGKGDGVTFHVTVDGEQIVLVTSSAN